MVWGFDAEGFPLSVGRLSGIDTMMGCDKLEVDSALEILLPDQDIESEPPFFFAPGRASETRMSFVQAICEGSRPKKRTRFVNRVSAFRNTETGARHLECRSRRR
jgi:hypothetical protein